MQLARTVWERDRHNRTPVMLPHRLAVKYPEYQFSWPWAWLFPAHNICRDPRSTKIVRYRMHEVNVQRAVKHARRQLGISVLPHCLRHAYATHCLDRGTNPRAIQKSVGHRSLETTMGYTHAEALSVPSPLDALPIILPALAGQSAFSGEPRAATAPAQLTSQRPVDASPRHVPAIVPGPRGVKIHNQVGRLAKPAPQSVGLCRKLTLPKHCEQTRSRSHGSSPGDCERRSKSAAGGGPIVRHLAAVN